MLDFSLSELAVVGTIALVVLGPERLPSAARTAGRWIGKARRFATQMQQELTSQLDAEELRKEMSEHQRLLDEQMQETRQALAQVQRDTQHALTDATVDPTKPVPTVIAPPRDHYAQQDEVAPWRPVASMPTPAVQDAPRPRIAASALRPTLSSDSNAATTTRNADDS
ncbi:Sec-independent protein translocase protein TatB [Zymobacter palmae]|uniref:Sec-independent protein translocase protein TatB n=1 Tax=Zymobacter palmae TaxID=33074 RepID=A0A348HD37_9GAMM|nr:Sec-independent protein translocase protein TatB [Zymobacter palmae]BBG29539.1 sec-independent protein translocase TatB [Zymobacter palmae]